MIRAAKRAPGAPLLALALVLVPAAGLAACTPRPDEPAAPAPSSAPGSPPAAASPPATEPGATASPAGPGGEVEGTGEGSEAEDEPVLVHIDRIDVAVLKSFPVQIHAVLRGNLSDACVEAAEAVVSRQGNTFTVTIPADRPPGRMCAQVLVPFERSVPLPVRDLPKGEYRILAHGASATFTLDRDNSFNPR